MDSIAANLPGENPTRRQSSGGEAKKAPSSSKEKTCAGCFSKCDVSESTCQICGKDFQVHLFFRKDMISSFDNKEKKCACCGSMADPSEVACQVSLRGLVSLGANATLYLSTVPSSSQITAASLGSALLLDPMLYLISQLFHNHITQSKWVYAQHSDSRLPTSFDAPRADLRRLLPSPPTRGGTSRHGAV